MKNKAKLIIAMLCLVMITAAGCGAKESNVDTGGDKVSAEKKIEYRCASAEEGRELLLSNEEYFAGFSQNDLDFKMAKVDANMDEYKAFAAEQTRDFTDKEKTFVDGCFEEMAVVIEENGYTLPPLDEIVMIKTTMDEEPGAAAYTHGTQIYIQDELLAKATKDKKIADYTKVVFWHELFHCLTRCNPEFRADMYKLIHFTVVDKDYAIPPSVFEYHISNPDVEHHNSYATFRIDGKDIDCFTDFVTTEHFRKKGDTFFDTGTTALIPIDGSDVYYTPEQAENFDEVFGTNTDYVIDPEECMADNFSLAMSYGLEGEKGKGYPNPEIIEGIIDYLKNN